jgi:hypothetical protein
MTAASNSNSLAAHDRLFPAVWRGRGATATSLSSAPSHRKASGVNVAFHWVPVGDGAQSPASFSLICGRGKRPKLAGVPLSGD